MSRVSVNWRDAEAFLLPFLADDIPVALARGEAKAVVTHWLQNPTKPPIFGDENLSQRWRTKLRAFASAQGVADDCDQWRPPAADEAVDIRYDVPFAPSKKSSFSFVDLFAGIGGFRIPLQGMGGKCLFSCEWNTSAKETYRKNFGETPFGDITNFTGDDVSDEDIERLVPDHDILAGGFPCQPFSGAGVSARNSLGQKHGFSCEMQGTLFFDMVRMAKVKRPKILFLENVKNLRSHDGGNTFRIIERTIKHDLKYSFNAMVVNASSLVPQRRERCFIVCTRDHESFTFPSFEGSPLPLKSILEDEVPEKYTISDKLWAGHQKRTKRNLARGAGFTAFQADLDRPANTLVARYGKDGKECLIPQEGKNPRKLTPKECARLQGFPQGYLLPQSDAAAYRQFGNAVPVPVVEVIARKILSYL